MGYLEKLTDLKELIQNTHTQSIASLSDLEQLNDQYVMIASAMEFDAFRFV